jgi:ketosteroid isomerase-like protein
MVERSATALEQEVLRIYELVDAMDTAAMAAMLADDVQGVDEITRGWLRGRPALEEYFGQLDGAVTDVHSKVSDAHTSDWGDVAAVTCVVDQSYKMDEQEQSITSPTSIVFRREGDEWEIALFHSVPVEEPQG